jgi:hypothetical protein
MERRELGLGEKKMLGKDSLPFTDHLEGKPCFV